MKNLIVACRREKTDIVPLWFMRQAGRYLPEYRAVREKAGGFLNLAFNPELAAEVTIQPLRRFGMSAAILFSDILVVPMGLGQGLRFAEGEGPILGHLDVEKLSMDRFDEVLKPVYETVSLARDKLGDENLSDAALIGFSGAPWTLSCYMIEGGSSRNFSRTKGFARKNPEQFESLLSKLTDSTIHYLCRQIDAGAEIVQIFDSWAGLLADDEFDHWCIAPVKKIVQGVKSKHPHVPIIGFPRGAGAGYERFALESGVDVLSMDQDVSLDRCMNLQKSVTVQGNLDPELLLKGGSDMERAAKKILEKLSGSPFIFNLGHGIIKETPPDHVKELSDIVRAWRP